MQKVLLILGALISISAWGAPDCSRIEGSIPDPTRAPGTVDATIPIDHIIVLMEENHSFDNFLGRLNVSGYGDEVDGVTPEMTNVDKGEAFHAFHQTSYCVADTNHSWDGTHHAWNNGANDGFVTQNGGGTKGARALGYYEEPDLEYLYAMANRFAIGDRYFSSLLGPTFPNRAYLYAGTSLGHIRNNFRVPVKTNLIFDVLTKYGVSWKYYKSDLSVAEEMLELTWDEWRHFAFMGQFRKDLRNGTLPSVVFMETSELLGEEHPPFDFQFGQKAMAKIINSLVKSPAWPRSALFLTYDEHGGYFDHVAPPPACKPDGIEPILDKVDSFEAGFDRYGIRVPLVVVSPWARRHYVSHVTYDHTSILKFIETKFNLPALTRRDANADAMFDLFDFASEPQLDYPTPPMPKAGLGTCLPWGHGRRGGGAVPRG